MAKRPLGGEAIRSRSNGETGTRARIVAAARKELIDGDGGHDHHAQHDVLHGV